MTDSDSCTVFPNCLISSMTRCTSVPKCSWNHRNDENKHFHSFLQYEGSTQGLSSATTTARAPSLGLGTGMAQPLRCEMRSEPLAKYRDSIPKIKRGTRMLCQQDYEIQQSPERLYITSSRSMREHEITQWQKLHVYFSHG